MTSDARHPCVCLRNKDTWLEMAHLSPFGLVLTFQAWLWPFWPVFGLSNTLYNLTFVFSHWTVNSFWTWFTREFAETVRFHRAGQSTLSDKLTISWMFISFNHIQRKQYLQEAKLQPKVKDVVYESEADNSGKNHSTSTRNPVHIRNGVQTVKITKKWSLFWSKS